MTKLAQNSKRQLWQYGITSAMAGGIYEGELTVEELLAHGDFGIGAPNYLNGELTVIDGRAWHTEAGKETKEAAATQKLSHAFALHFSPDFEFTLEGVTNEATLEQRIGAQLSNRNGMYAFRIRGEFDDIKTRAFPPVPADCHTPTAELMGREYKFHYPRTKGFIVATRIPAWLDGVNIPGYHFHFISDDHKQGGHVLSFLARELKVEVCIIDEICVRVQDSEEFQKFNFEKVSSEDIQRLEAGK